MEWSRGVEWSGVEFGVESILHSCYLGRAFGVELKNESTFKKPKWMFNFEQVMVTSKMQKKTESQKPLQDFEYTWNVLDTWGEFYGSETIFNDK